MKFPSHVQVQVADFLIFFLLVFQVFKLFQFNLLWYPAVTVICHELTVPCGSHCWSFQVQVTILFRCIFPGGQFTVPVTLSYFNFKLKPALVPVRQPPLKFQVQVICFFRVGLPWLWVPSQVIVRHVSDDDSTASRRRPQGQVAVLFGCFVFRVSSLQVISN